MDSPGRRREGTDGWMPVFATAAGIAALLLAPVGTFESEPWWPSWADRLFALSAIGLDKAVHAGLFALFAWTLLRSPMRAVRHGLGLILGLATLYGGLLEFVQLYIPGRDCDIFDLTADVVGAAIVVIAFRRARSRNATTTHR